MKKINLLFLSLLLIGLTFLPVSNLRADDVNTEAEALNNQESPGSVNVLVLRRGNGYGVVTQVNDAVNKIDCGQTCMVQVPVGAEITLSATAKEGSEFLGWAYFDNSNSDNFNITSSEYTFTVSKKMVIYAKFTLTETPEVPVVAESDRNIPRIMLWFGKVNQHWNLDTGVWETDADGVSGARENKLEYCRKFYPETVKVIEHKKETINTWHNAGNLGDYASIKMSYRCVQPGNDIAGTDVSDRPEKPNAGSVCYYYPDLPLCVPLSDPNAQRYANVQPIISDFVEYGVDDNTNKLGAGERAAVLHSYQVAFGDLPKTEDDVVDMVKIANGKWPSKTSVTAENKAKEEFKNIYKKVPDMDNQHDQAAVTVMAYGLRQQATNRNLDSEKQGIKTFSNIYRRTPESTEDWNVVQAITYSGATRGVDTDRDLLTDERELALGTDPNKADTDGDGYIDGIEVANGYDPLSKD